MFAEVFDPGKGLEGDRETGGADDDACRTSRRKVLRSAN